MVEAMRGGCGNSHATGGVRHAEDARGGIYKEETKVKKHATLRTACLLLPAVVFGARSTASASLIDPGFDFFRTLDGAFIPDFGFGDVSVMGVPLGGPGDLGVTDTIVERLQGINPFDPPGGFGTVDIELVALHLVSIVPLDIGQLVDVHVTVNKNGIIPGLPQPDALAPSLGTMDIFHTNPDGGTFSSSLTVNADVIFTIPGGDPANPLDVILSQPAAPVLLQGTGTWKHTPPSGYPINPLFPAGGFFIQPGFNHQGPHPTDPVPAPGTLALLAIGGLLIRRRRRR
ncbi:MAG: PEP-CTERM sorting domain-containing protein [Planctomycetes bacterium]|nr:PEP-CTERM sorting domain-containing protein [Planctomycetota bacterium]